MINPEAKSILDLNGRTKPGSNDALCFMETQFPISKLSIESYTERKANLGQTLTSVGKWWGRKPLVLCRAIILGLLLPSTNDPIKDREIFLRLMTMDNDGMLQRKSANIPAIELFRRLGPSDRSRYFTAESSDINAKLRKDISREAKDELQLRIFFSMSYEEKQQYCFRPEQIEGPSPKSWRVINDHLGTNATSLSQLVVEFGQRKYGHIPRIGDAFCGGGSIPFEAARLGFDAYGSDLNPVASLLTWASINVIGGNQELAKEIRSTQENILEEVDGQVTAWGIEHREPDEKTGRRWRAAAYFYCVEATCPECKWRIPLSPSWVIGRGSRTVVRLIPDMQQKRFDFEVLEGQSEAAIKLADDAGTIKDSELICPNPNCKAHTPIRSIRGDGRGFFGESKSLLRGWENQDIVPREGDIFGERLYCIRWTDTWTDSEGKEHNQRYYRAPASKDIAREQKVLTLLKERFEDWQRKGFIPSRKIEPGYNTTQPIRERGWTHWHHLFTPRQLLLNGLISQQINSLQLSKEVAVALLLNLGFCCDWNSRLSRIHNAASNEGIVEQVFDNQALDTLYNYGTRPLSKIRNLFKTLHFTPISRLKQCIVQPKDARSCSTKCELWITDPPYADAVNYDEISEFFLSWYEGSLRHIFPDWYTDSKRALAVKGSDDNFRKAMFDCYRNLTEHMPDNGLQVVMFTHQDVGVWADLTVILWAAGLRVTAAWCIGTETSTGLKDGNYVQGTVLLVLRKQKLQGTAFLDEIYPEVESEVRRQLDSMLNIDDTNDPNFSDTDYQLAAYAAALRVLTSKKIEDIDVSYELTRTRARDEISPIEELIRNAVAIACDHLVPHGIDRYLWKSISAMERFYLKGLEMESHGECRIGVYQELARGFGILEYKPLLADSKANQSRLKTASEFGRKELSGEGFAGTLLRQVLFGIFKTNETESPREAITWFMNEIKDYSGNRGRIIEIIEYIATLRQNSTLVHWHKDAEAAAILAGALRNRQDNV